MSPIPIGSIIDLNSIGITNCKLHLAGWNRIEHPLDVYVQDKNQWKAWNEWRDNKDDFNRAYIFTLINYYHEPNKWLFGGIYKITNRHNNYKATEVGYEVELVDLHTDFIGRLIIDFTRYQGMRGRSFKLENYFSQFTVSEILKQPYDGAKFPGYENINLSFTAMQSIIKGQKTDWKAALEHIKGVYAIFDQHNGKKYVGSAYGDSGIWARWLAYAESGHGYNRDLVQLISEKGIDYAKRHFTLTLLEYRPARTDDAVIIARESFWKEVLISRGAFGYNSN